MVIEISVIRPTVSVPIHRSLVPSPETFSLHMQEIGTISSRADVEVRRFSCHVVRISVDGRHVLLLDVFKFWGNVRLSPEVVVAVVSERLRLAEYGAGIVAG